MPTVLFTPIANEDLQQLCDYLAIEADEEVADRFISTIEDSATVSPEIPNRVVSVPNCSQICG